LLCSAFISRNYIAYYKNLLPSKEDFMRILALVQGYYGDRIVERGAPCGSTHFNVKKGMTVDKIVLQAELKAHIYPCLASMQIEDSSQTIQTQRISLNL